MTTEHTEEAIKNSVRQLVAEMTERQPSEVSDTAHFVDDLEIDSLMSLEMMVAVNKRYRIQLFEEEFGTIKNVNDAVAIVRRHLALVASNKS
jgi:acyl carrier protein